MRSIQIGIARAIVVAIAVAVAAFAYADARPVDPATPPVGETAAPARSGQASAVEAAIAGTNLARKLEVALGEDFGGVWFEASTAQLAVGVTSPMSRRNAKAVAAQVGLSRNVIEVSVESSWAQLRAAQKRWANRLGGMFARGQVSTGLAPDRNSLEVKLSSAVPYERRAALEQAAAADAVNVGIEAVPRSSLFARPAERCVKWVKSAAFCNPTIAAGVTLDSEDLGGGMVRSCTGGPAAILKDRAQKDAATKTYLIASGHCLANGGGVGKKWYSYDKNGKKEEVGTAVAVLTGETDAGAIELSTKFWAKKDPIPVVPAVAVWNPAAEVDPTPISSQVDAIVGARTCFSGQRGGKVCGLVLETEAMNQFQGQKEVTKGLTRVGLDAGKFGGEGDSGGPFYDEKAPKFIEGIFVGYTSVGGKPEGSTVFFHPMDVVFQKLDTEKKLTLELLTQANENRHPKVKAGSYPVTIHGSTTAGQKFTTEAGSVECKSSTYHALVSEGEKETSKLTVTPVYKECKALFLGMVATVEMEGCAYVFHVAEKALTDHYRAYSDISCPAGKSIKIAAFTCKAEIKAQTERETVDLVDDTGASPKKDITAQPTLTGIAYAVTQDGAFCPFNGTGEKTGGEYASAGSITLTGQNPSEPGQKIDIEISGP